MNIFYISSDPQEAAQFHNNSHLIKMVLESAQLLSTAHRVLDGTPKPSISATGRKSTNWVHPDSTFDSILYKATHINHPSAVWVRESSEHYEWLYQLFTELMIEYTHRYNKIHACSHLLKCLSKIPKNIQSNGFHQPPLAMPDDCKISEDAVECYREYYRKYKAPFSVWKNRDIPEWFGTKITA